MFKPSPVLCARLRFTTKEVGRGFYRGSKVGSKGAHTEYGGYIVDWRKVRHYNVPDLENFELTPFVTAEMAPTSRLKTNANDVSYTPKKVDGMEYLRSWKEQNIQEYDYIKEYQQQSQEVGQEPADAAAAEAGTESTSGGSTKTT